MASVGLYVLFSCTLWLPLAAWLLWLVVDVMGSRKRMERRHSKGLNGMLSRLRAGRNTPLVVVWGGFGVALPLVGGILFQSKSEIISLIGIVLWQSGVFSQLIISILFTMIIGLRFSARSGEGEPGRTGRAKASQGRYWMGLFGNTLLSCALAVIPYFVTLIFVTFSLRYAPPPPVNFNPQTSLLVRDLNLLLRKADATTMLLYWIRLIPFLFLFAVFIGGVVRSRLIGGIVYLTALWLILPAFWVSSNTEVRPGDIVVQNFPSETHTMTLVAATTVCLGAAWFLFTVGWRPINMRVPLRWVGRKYMGSR